MRNFGWAHVALLLAIISPAKVLNAVISTASLEDAKFCSQGFERDAHISASKRCRTNIIAKTISSHPLSFILGCPLRSVVEASHVAACKSMPPRTHRARNVNMPLPRLPGPLSTLEEKLGVSFHNVSLLERALVHRSTVENSLHSNQRLEFLGDSILGMVVADHLFRNNPHLSEGELTAIRREVVNTQALAKVAMEQDLGEWILMAQFEVATGGRKKESLLADTVESIIAAVYLDKGLDAARNVILKWTGDIIRHAIANPAGTDFKTRLQERMLQLGLGAPEYVVFEQGVKVSAHISYDLDITL